ncbi:hypothetical protein AAEX28_04660 [Lentisphaerota bacterium WC36G]|nr:hypothetical protein LJT99_07520 [Lentisphaerae bacterium WC36]
MNINNSTNKAPSTTKRQKVLLMQSLLTRANIKVINTHLKRAELIALLMLALNRLANQAIKANINIDDIENNAKGWQNNINSCNDNKSDLTLKLNNSINIKYIYNNNSSSIDNNINNSFIMCDNHQENYSNSFLSSVDTECDKQIKYIDKSSYSDNVGSMAVVIYKALCEQLRSITMGARCNPDKQAKILGQNSNKFK